MGGVQQALSDGAAVDAAQDDGSTALHKAAFNGQLDICRTLLDRGVDASAADRSQFTPLHEACQAGHARVCELLIEHGADLEAKDCDGQTPLFQASRFNRPEAAGVLLKEGADLDARGLENRAPLHAAAFYGSSEVVDVMLAHGADPQVTSAHAFTDTRRHPHLLVMVSSHHRYEDVTPLHSAMMSDSTNSRDIARSLLGAGANPDALMSIHSKFQKNTPLDSSNPVFHKLTPLSICRSADAATILIERGASIQGVEGSVRPMLSAVVDNRPEVAAVLAYNGADFQEFADRAQNHGGFMPRYERQMQACIATQQTADFERDTAAVLADDFNPNAAPEANAVPSDEQPPSRRQRMRL